jgi:SAM-dependent methyltransferase
MAGLRSAIRRITMLRGVPQARHVTERVVAPYLRHDLHSLHLDHVALVQRIENLERAAGESAADAARLRAHISSVAHTIDQIERHQPAVLNAIASVNGTVRILRRELEAVAQIAGASDETGALMSSSRELQETTRRLTLELERIRQRTDDAHAAIADVYNHIRRIQQETATGDANVLAEVRPHLDTLSWLVGRVEVVRAEVMNELRYGGGADAGADAGRGRGARPGDVGSQPPKVVNAAAMSPADGDLRVNLGAGHIPLDGFVNVDIREIPGIDVVASVDDLPFEDGSVAEIFSAHTLEHFPEEELRRRLLPYWTRLLRPGGTFRAVVPDMEAMTKAYSTGTMPFDTLRSVAYGGQEYAGDFHFTGFTPESLSALLEGGGLVDATIVARARENGDSLECEVKATRPSR